MVTTARVIAMNSHTERLLEMLDEGYLDPKATVKWLVGRLSDDDVGELLDALLMRFTEDIEETDDE